MSGIRNNCTVLVTLLILGFDGQIFAGKHGEDSKDQTKPYVPMVEAIKVEKAPVIDGEILREEVWQAAKPVTQFWQTTPNEGEKASEKTEVRVIYTTENLYFGVYCYDKNPKGIIVSDSRRDASLNETDCFQIVLDTYFDKQNAFLFGTNPAGIEYDAQITNEGQENFGNRRRRRGGAVGGFNINWDGSWQVRSKITDKGWCAEFAIPFRTLRFASGKNQIWGINFQRNIRRRNESAYWAKLPRQFNIRKISMAGSLVGLENIQQKNLKLIPYSLGNVDRDFENQLDTQWDGDFGVDVKYSLTPSMTLDATFNTDFAQVEVDEQQINLNRFNLFFPEKRPFFLENAGLFSVGSPGEVELFFSRRIGISEDRDLVPILGGLRLSGKTAGFNVGLLNMQTKTLHSDTLQANNFTVARLNREFPNRSALGVIFVNRQGTGDLAPDRDYNRAYAVDGRLGIGQYGQIAGYAAGTSSVDSVGKGYAFNFGASYDSEAWRLSAVYTQVADNFNPEVGFLRRSGFRKANAAVLYRYRPKNFLGLLELRPHTSYEGYWNFNGFQETGFWHIDNHWEWRSGHQIHTGVNFTREGVTEAFEIFPEVEVRPGTYDNVEAMIVAFTNRGAWWSASIRSNIGGFFGGKRVALRPSLRFRIGDAFNTEFSLSHNNIDLPEGSFDTNLFQARLSYSFTPRIFVQGLFQYNDRDDLTSMNLRFGWQQSANTGLFIVYNDTRDVFERKTHDKFRSLIVKYSHLFDLLN